MKPPKGLVFLNFGDHTSLGWMAWLQRHSIDYHEVIVPGWVWPDPLRRRVWWLGGHLGIREGHNRKDCPTKPPMRRGDPGDFCFEAKFVQLEGPPELPTPPTVYIPSQGQIVLPEESQ
jgi:hypothetical protein